MGRKPKGEICPRCNEKGFFTVRHTPTNDYAYFVHTKNKKRHSCYLGPANEYKRVEYMLSLGLSGITSFNYKLVLEKLLNKMIVNNVRLKQEEYEKYVKMLDSLRIH